MKFRVGTLGLFKPSTIVYSDGMARYGTLQKLITEKLEDKEQAEAYLEVALEDFEQTKNAKHLLQSLRNVVEARGGISELAKRTNMNRQSLYKALSGQGNPRLSTIGVILHGLGYKLALEPLEEVA